MTLRPCTPVVVVVVLSYDYEAKTPGCLPTLRVPLYASDGIPEEVPRLPAQMAPGPASLITEVTEAEARALARSHRCGELGCGGRLVLAWQGAPPPAWGQGRWVLRCGKDSEHGTIKRASRTRQLYDSERGWIEVDIMTQKEVGIPGALAVPQTPQAMLERADQTLQAGLWPQSMTQGQKALMVQVALAYGLDPLMGEIVLYQGKPLITINARRRKDVEAGHRPSIRFRFLSAEEKQGYLDAGAINEGDLVQVGILTTEWGSTVEGIGKVTKSERETTSPRSRDPRNLSHPIVADNPIEMCQKRAEARVRLMAYGPIPLPQIPGIMVSDIATAGVTVEGEILNQGEVAGASAPPLVYEPLNDEPPENEVEEFQAFMEQDVPSTRTTKRDRSLLRQPQDLFHACWEDFKLQPLDVLRFTGYGKALDLTGQNLEALYWQVAESVRK